MELTVEEVAQDFASEELPTQVVAVAVAVGVGEMWMFELMILVFRRLPEKSQKILTKEEEPKIDSDFPLLLELHRRKLNFGFLQEERGFLVQAEASSSVLHADSSFFHHLSYFVAALYGKHCSCFPLQARSNKVRPDHSRQQSAP